MLKATIDTLEGRSRGQYDIRFGRPAGIDRFFAGIPRERTGQGGVELTVPIAAATHRVAAARGPIVVPETSIEIGYVGPESSREDWRVTSQRPGSAYPLWAKGVREAKRREQELQRAYADYLCKRGEVVIRNKIPVPGSASNLYTDLWVESRGHLIEAKASATRNDIRMAIGQLADYARFLPEAKRRVVLLGSQPASDLLDLLASCGVGAVWRSGRSFKDNAGGGFT